MSRTKVPDVVKDRSPASFADWFTDRFWGDLFKWPGDVPMKVEEIREDAAVVVRAELPGLDPDKDVEVTVADGVLRIHAERTQQSTTDDPTCYRSEFSYGSFTRTFRLPMGATEDDVKATYKDGILEVRVPIDENRSTTHRVPVTAT